MSESSGDIVKKQVSTSAHAQGRKGGGSRTMGLLVGKVHYYASVYAWKVVARLLCAGACSKGLFPDGGNMGASF